MYWTVSASKALHFALKWALSPMQKKCLSNLVPGSGSLISGNFLGTNASGTAVVTTGYTGANLGVSVQSANNTIGGTSAAARNVIGVRSNGVENGSSATGTLIQGNFIGTDHTGTVGFLVGNSGVHDNGANSITIGGTVSGARNVISGNSGDGLDITGSFVVIEGNFIGTDVTGTNAVGNNSGVSICGSCMNDKIGGRTAGARNIISGAARAQIFRRRKLAGKRSGGSAVVHQSPAELWVCVLRVRRADEVNVSQRKSTALAF